MQAPLRIRNLACRRGTRVLFRGLDLEVGAGQAVWLRGANGRGKTSLLRVVAGLSSADEGEVARGRDIVFIGHANGLKDDLTAAEALAFLLRVHGRDARDVDAALHRMGMGTRRDAMVRTLSQGQRRRVALARLAAERDALLWVLDEPYDALDAEGVDALEGLLAGHLARGGGVLMASHVTPGGSARAIAVDLDRLAPTPPHPSPLPLAGEREFGLPLPLAGEGRGEGAAFPRHP